MSKVIKLFVLRGFAVVGILLLLVAFVFCKDLGYYFLQAKGQWRILSGVVPVEAVMSDDRLGFEYRQKLQLVGEIKKFGRDSLGLAATDNYTTFYDQKDKPVLWVLSASAPYSFTAHTWWFPIVGRVGYKGFFDYEKGLAEERQLTAEGLDTDLGEVSAWSTLGWFKDPILSSMLSKSEGEMARLLLHEMTHTTIYFDSDADFNENFATLIGDVGAERFLSYYFGDTSTQLEYYKKRMADLQLYQTAMERGIARLDSAYQQMEIDSLPVEERSQTKQFLIARLKSEIAALPFYMPSRFARLSADTTVLNNAFFMGFRMYRAQLDSLKDVLITQHKGDIRNYLDVIKSE
ncbi:MAG: aminopeptidase [Flavobacteriales bacterium]|nr:aminopeptidase [Flavobacteriales bacterium]